VATKPQAEVLDVVSAALLLGATEKAVRQRIARRLLPFRRLGGRIVFLRAELETFLSDLPGVTVDEARENLAAQQGEAVRQ